MCPNSGFPEVFSLPFLSTKRGEETTTEEAFGKPKDVTDNSEKGNGFMPIPVSFIYIFIGY